MQTEREVPQTNSDMQWLAEGLFVQLNTLREEPGLFLSTFTTLWAQDELRENWELSSGNYEPFLFNEAISSSIRQVLNEQGACGTFGDSTSTYVKGVLTKYYAFDYEGLELLSLTSCELVDQDDYFNSP